MAAQQPIGAEIKIDSAEIVNFNFAMSDVKLLLDLHDDATKKAVGKPGRNLEVYKRAAVILSITAWESFIEDSIRVAATKRIDAAASPAEISSTFNYVADSWIGQGNATKPPNLSKWAGDGWKSILKEALAVDLAALNTPGSKNIQGLTKRYLGKDITADWRWRNSTKQATTKRLDDLIKTRGALVHRGPEMLKSAAVVRADVNNALVLLPKLAECTEKSLRS